MSIMQTLQYLCCFGEKCELSLKTVPNQQPMCSTAERQWSLHTSPLQRSAG